MGGGTPLMRPAGQGEKIIPGWQLAANFALRQLQQQRGKRLGDCLEIVERQQAIRLTDRDPAQTVQFNVPGEHSEWHMFRPDVDEDAHEVARKYGAVVPRHPSALAAQPWTSAGAHASPTASTVITRWSPS